MIPMITVGHNPCDNDCNNNDQLTICDRSTGSYSESPWVSPAWCHRNGLARLRSRSWTEQLNLSRYATQPWFVSVSEWVLQVIIWLANFVTKGVKRAAEHKRPNTLLISFFCLDQQQGNCFTYQIRETKYLWASTRFEIGNIYFSHLEKA